MNSKKALLSYKRPESVLVVIYTLQGDFLLMERTHPRGFWQSVTGSLEWGEQAKATAVRELYEETGLQAGSAITDLHQAETFAIIYPWKKRYAPNAFYNREHWFALPLSSRRSIRLQRNEHRQYRWLAAADAVRRASSWTNRKAIQQIAQSLAMPV